MFHPLNFTESTQIVTKERNDWFFKQMPVRQRKGFRGPYKVHSVWRKNSSST